MNPPAETYGISSEMKDKVEACVKEQRALMVGKETAGFPTCVLHQPMEVLDKAVPLMAHYKHRQYEEIVDDFSKGQIDPKRPAFCQLWGESRVDDVDWVEVVAYVGQTSMAYPLLIPQEVFSSQYILD